MPGYLGLDFVVPFSEQSHHREGNELNRFGTICSWGRHERGREEYIWIYDS